MSRGFRAVPERSTQIASGPDSRSVASAALSSLLLLANTGDPEAEVAVSHYSDHRFAQTARTAVFVSQRVVHLGQSSCCCQSASATIEPTRSPSPRSRPNATAPQISATTTTPAAISG